MLKTLLKKKRDSFFPSFKQPNYLNTMPPAVLGELLGFVEKSHFHVPFAGNRILYFYRLENADLLEGLKFPETSELICYRTQREPLSQTIQTIDGPLLPTTIKSESFDTLVFPGATQIDDNFENHFKHFSRLLVNGGRLSFSVIHPQLEFLLTHQNPSSIHRSVSSLSRYFKLFRAQNLFAEIIDEFFVDASCKPFFMEGDNDRAYEELRGFPLILFFNLIKYTHETSSAS